MEPDSPIDQRPRGVAKSEVGAELRATLALAAPLATANLAQMAMAVTDAVMVGRLGAMSLAAYPAELRVPAPI
jgi:Na+-driven multidrug efflux pump